MTMAINTQFTMKYHNIIKSALLGLLTLGFAAGCAQEAFEEVTELNLKRCLEPLNLRAKVNSSVGDVVTFSWDVNKDAEGYTLEVYEDAAMTKLNFSEDILPDQVPYERKLSPDMNLHFRVKATSSKRDDSAWAVYGSTIKTFAVKDNLFLEVTAKTMNSVSLSWSKDLEDYREVDHIEYGAPGVENRTSYTLSAAEIEAASAVITGEGDAALQPGTEYEIMLFFKTARRGQVNVWTNVDPSQLTEVNSVAGLQNALATEGAKIYLKLEGSPYVLKTQSVSKPVSIYGESAADGSMPVIVGELEFRAPLTKGSWHFESVAFDGQDETYGFLIQLDKAKKDFMESPALFESITFRNCKISNYSKGLIYEWDQTYDAESLTFESCTITDINVNMNGGDVLDLRKASKFGKIAFVNNTIVNGGRTWLRVDSAPSIEAFVFENNTVQALGNPYDESKYSMGIMGFQTVPGSFSFKNNLFLNMVADSRFGSDKANYKYASDLGMTAANNYYYNVPSTYFSDNYAPAKMGMKKLNVDPCYNSKGGYFNLDPDSDIAGLGVGASKWWTPYVEKEEDLTLNAVEGNKVWNFADASLFAEKIKREMVRDYLYINASDDYMLEVKDGILSFPQATSVNRKNLPLAGYLAFKVNTPGSILVKPVDPDGKGAHILVGVGPVDHSSVTIKGGASALTDQSNVQKILVKGIVEESLVYVWASGPISLEQLAWSTDVTPVNTALAAPAPEADPATVTSGEATPVTVTWEPVEGAASYTVIFSGKSYTVEEPSYVVPGGTVSMLDPGSYRVEVYANPGADDIYNTESPAGVAAFAVLSAGGDEGGVLVVKDIDGLNNAILAGKSEITLAPGEYDLGLRDVDGDGNPDGAPVLQVTAPLSLTGQDGAVVLGGFKLSGEVGTFSLKNLTVNAEASKLDGETLKKETQGILVDLDNSAGVKADAIIVENVVATGFAKSLIYASNTAGKFNIAKILFKGIEVYKMGAGQGVFDLRNGTYGSFTLEESTVVDGRDFLRVDATCTIDEIYVRRNTLYNLNDSKNANGIFCVRSAAPKAYVVSYNIFGRILGSISGRTAAVKPTMARNAWYNIGDTFYTGCIDADLSIANNGFNLTADPFKDAANNDFTLTDMLARSCGVGAPKWNPAADATPSNSITVKSSEELASAIEAGKSDIFLAKGEYQTLSLKLTPNMRLSGEEGTVLNLTQFDLTAEEPLGSLIIENLDIRSRAKDDEDNSVSNNLINIGVGAVADRLIVRNCTVTGVAKSLVYGNNDNAKFGAVVFSNVVVKSQGTGQGIFDFRKGQYDIIKVEDCTITGGRDAFRVDEAVVNSVVNVSNNLLDKTTPNGNGLFYIRSKTNEQIVITNNLFLNMVGGTALFGKKDSKSKVPTQVVNNHFFNLKDGFWGGIIDEAAGTAGGGSVLTADPCQDAANGDYTLTGEALRNADVGPARWNSLSPVLRSRRNRK